MNAWLLLTLICLLLALACTQAQAELLDLGILRMLRMGNRTLWQHLAEWRNQADDRTQRLFALVSAGLVLFAVSGLAAAMLGLIETLH